MHNKQFLISRVPLSGRENIHATNSSLQRVFSCSVMSDSLPPHFLCPRNFPGKNTGVGCHFLLQGNLPDPGIEPKSVSCTGRQILYHLESYHWHHLGRPCCSIEQDILLSVMSQTAWTQIPSSSVTLVNLLKLSEAQFLLKTDGGHTSAKACC